MTTFTATNTGTANAVAGVGDGHGLKAVVGVFTLGAALALNDVIASPTLPKGATIVDVIVTATDLDTNGTPTISLDVGYGDDPDYFIQASTIGQTGGVARASAPTAKPLLLALNDTVDVTVKAAPATGATTGTVSIVVLFLPPNA
ncbi:hypothetical protein [Pandoraea apista]|uniref:hypothetical protein n=1 Tax=Pandoraea apista TaxID=93218 RepID=UPI00065968DA|nr:hypothetical protein [Pandoraea apista]ALS63620.1 hypothetical protein AT395_00170 [Pandoraea apista]CFB63149.1 hypothetical protein LMG16407_03224 [Pandoraea apista]